MLYNLWLIKFKKIIEIDAGTNQVRYIKEIPGSGVA